MIKKLSAPLALALSATLLASCATGSGKARDTDYVARDVATLYNAAKLRLDRGDYKIAAALFGEVERQHPFSPWARRAQIMGAFAHYMGRDYKEAINSATRFVGNNRGSANSAYAYYLIAISHYEQLEDVTRDQTATSEAMKALRNVIQFYPDTPYAADARLKLDLVYDHLAAKEMSVGRFYQRRGQWLAASLRFRNVIEQYDRTSQTPEALYRLVECGLALGLPEEARKSAAVLGANYPENKWYERAYKLMADKAPNYAQ